MSAKSRWVFPCYFLEGERKTDPITFDLTNNLKLFLSNEVWNRKFDYGFGSGLKNTDVNDIEKASVVIYPRFISGYVNDNRIKESIEEYCGKIPPHHKINNYKEWRHSNGFGIIEVEYKTALKNIPSKEEFLQFQFKDKFVETYHRHIAVLKELASFFLAGMHITFPTRSYMMSNDNPINDGFFQILSGRKTYSCQLSTNAFMHEILIEKNKLSILEANFNHLASVWHFDLWPLKRYLISVESDRISMDNLLDLIYALEGLFNKNTSSDFIKLFCVVSLCDSKKKAKELKDLLNSAFRIRNEIAHGERSYDGYDYIQIAGKETLVQDVYWKLKALVAVMISKAISKLISNKEQRNLKFNEDDLLLMLYK